MRKGEDPSNDGCDIAAVRELQRRLTRLRLMVMVPTIPLAFVGGCLVLGIWALIGKSHRDVSVPAMMLVGFGMVLGAGWLVYRALTRALAPVWVRELAGKHGVTPAELEMTAAPYLRFRGPRLAYGRWAIAAAIGFVGMLVLMGMVYFSVNDWSGQSRRRLRFQATEDEGYGHRGERDRE